MPTDPQDMLRRLRSGKGLSTQEHADIADALEQAETELSSLLSEAMQLRRAVFTMKAFRRKWHSLGFPPRHVMDAQAADALSYAPPPPDPSPADPVNAVPVDALKDRPADALCLSLHHRLPDSEGACDECIEAVRHYPPAPSETKGGDA